MKSIKRGINTTLIICMNRNYRKKGDKMKRNFIKKYRDMTLEEVQELLDSKIHEHRGIALAILISKYNKTEDKRF